MELSIEALLRHSYLIVLGTVFLESVGLPIPAALVMLLAGSACAQGSLSSVNVMGCALIAMTTGDVLMYLLGRYTGWWLLGMLCRLSLHPESCIFRSADSFYKRGRKLLLVAKFLPGINTMAAPLSGSMRMRPLEFLRLDIAGAAFYLGTYFAAGYAFSGAIGVVTKGYKAFGHVLGFIFLAIVVAYAARQVWMWLRARALPPVPSVSPSDAARELASGNALIFDVRSHGYYEPRATRIQGSKRLEPTAVSQSPEQIPQDRQLFVYCTCVRQATSARVARELLKSGTRCAVIEGGLREWKRAGLPMESVPEEEITALPAFHS